MAGKSGYKLWDLHVIGEEGQLTHGTVDQHYIRGRQSPSFSEVWKITDELGKKATELGTFDHNVPTVNIYDY